MKKLDPHLKCGSFFIYYIELNFEIMGCHTWCFRPVTQDEANRFKKGKVGFILEIIEMWNSCVNNEFENVCPKRIDYLSDIDLSTLSKEEYGIKAKEIIYEYMYLESTTAAQENLKRFLSVPKDEWGEGVEEYNDKFAQMYGFENFDALIEHERILSNLSFEEFCAYSLEQYTKLLEPWDMDSPETFTDKDPIIEGKCYNMQGGGLIRTYNGKLYTDYNEPHDIFRVYDYSFPTQYNEIECIDQVNLWKINNNEKLLTNEELDDIHEFFTKYNGDCFIEFG